MTTSESPLLTLTRASDGLLGLPTCLPWHVSRCAKQSWHFRTKQREKQQLLQQHLHKVIVRGVPELKYKFVTQQFVPWKHVAISWF